MSGQPDQYGEVPTSGLAPDAHPVRVDPQLAGVGPQPPDRRFGVVQGRREGSLSGVPVVDRGDGKPFRQQCVEDLIRRQGFGKEPAVPEQPGPAVHPDHQRDRPAPGRDVQVQLEGPVPGDRGVHRADEMPGAVGHRWWQIPGQADAGPGGGHGRVWRDRSSACWRRTWSRPR